jgi:ribose 5-phosphate isomerase B
MKIAFGCDHGAFELKNELVEYVRSLGHEVNDMGIHVLERVDYPVYGAMVGRAVASGEADLGFVLCGTGVGISIAANKIHGVRAACVSEPYSARMARLHNDANVLGMGGRVLGPELAKMIVDEFLNNEPEGGRHAERRKLIAELDDER